MGGFGTIEAIVILPGFAGLSSFIVIFIFGKHGLVVGKDAAIEIPLFDFYQPAFCIVRIVCDFRRVLCFLPFQVIRL